MAEAHVEHHRDPEGRRYTTQCPGWCAEDYSHRCDEYGGCPDAVEPEVDEEPEVRGVLVAVGGGRYGSQGRLL